MNEKTYPICYEFHFSRDHVECFDIQLDLKTFALLYPSPPPPPPWTRLGSQQCYCCPLDEKTTRFCPVAVNISTVEETLVRSDSMYLLRQYFEHQHNRSPDFKLVRLHAHYEKVQLLNEGLLSRISGLKLKKDSDKNALLLFHSISQLLSFELNTSLKSIAYLFTDQGEDIWPSTVR